MKKIKRRKPNRSRGGDLGIYIMLILFGILDLAGVVVLVLMELGVF